MEFFFLASNAFWFWAKVKGLRRKLKGVLRAKKVLLVEREEGNERRGLKAGLFCRFVFLCGLLSTIKKCG